MTPIARLLMLAVWLHALPVAATAQEVLAKRVSLDLKAMAPAEAFKVLADAVGTRVTVDPAVTAPVDILVRNVSARTALNTICESISCRWTADAAGIAVKPGGGAAVAEPKGRGGEMKARTAINSAYVERVRAAFKQPLPAGMVFHSAPLATVSAHLSKALEFQLIITTDDPAFQTITADFSGMTFQAAIRSLLDRAEKRRTEFRITFKDPDGPKEPTVAIMVGGGAKKKKK